MWIWDDIKKFFSGLVDGVSTFLGFSSLVGLRDEFTEQVQVESDLLIYALMQEGEITIQQWTLSMRELIKNVYRAQYELGIGGSQNMTQADYGRLGGILQEQYRYLQNFAQEIADGKLSISQALYRARLYIDSSTQAFERARAAGYGLTLPQYPGDGSTRCLANCKCEWEIKQTDFFFECFWRLGYAEHCPDCIEASQVYNPYLAPR